MCTTGERIKKARKAAKFTQIELAEMAGIAVNSLRLYESGKREPRLSTLEKIANILGADPYWLTSGYISTVLNVGGKIRSLRISQGMTQKELGEKLGVSQSAINQYEKSQNLSLNTMRRIAKALNIDITVLLGTGVTVSNGLISITVERYQELLKKEQILDAFDGIRQQMK